MSCVTSSNFLENNGFRLVINRLPNVTFFTQNVKLPGLRTPAANQLSPFQTTPISGLQPTYDPFIIEFKVDEFLQNYFAVHQWMVELGTPQSFSQSSGEVFHSQMSLFILDSNGNNTKEIILHNGFPIALSGVDFTTQNINPIWVNATATFAITHFSISNR